MSHRSRWRRRLRQGLPLSICTHKDLFCNNQRSANPLSRHTIGRHYEGNRRPLNQLPWSLFDVTNRKDGKTFNGSASHPNREKKIHILLGVCMSMRRVNKNGFHRTFILGGPIVSLIVKFDSLLIPLSVNISESRHFCGRKMKRRKK